MILQPGQFHSGEQCLLCRAEIEGMMAIVVRGDALVASDVDKVFDQIEEVRYFLRRFSMAYCICLSSIYSKEAAVTLLARHQT